jgi:hypothetical protein
LEDNQLSSIPEKILDFFPLATVALMLISGAIFFLLSPLSFFVPKFLYNPFINLTPTDILSSFGVIVICALILGVVFFAIKDAVLGNDGLNSRVRHPLKKKPIKPKKEEDKEGFYRWIKHNDDAAKYNDFVFLKYSVIAGLLLGFEVTFLADLFYLAGIALSPFVSACALSPFVATELKL